MLNGENMNYATNSCFDYRIVSHSELRANLQNHESLSFVTENVAEHTNETIGALLNATFGNAPEVLISSAALRSGYYRIVQLTLLGSVLTNLLFVFGISCFIGGLRWQTQTLRITSGNVSIGMLLAACMGLVLPAALKLANESVAKSGENDATNESDVAFSRFNSIIMVFGYLCYLIFQLGSHKEEFEFEGDGDYNSGSKSTANLNSKNHRTPPRQNRFCRRHCFFVRYRLDDESYVRYDHIHDTEEGVELNGSRTQHGNNTECSRRGIHIPQSLEDSNVEFAGQGSMYQKNTNVPKEESDSDDTIELYRTKSKSSDVISLGEIDDIDTQTIPMTMRVSPFASPEPFCLSHLTLKPFFSAV